MSPAPIYQYASLLFVEQELANRLYDPGMVFWSAAELQSLIAESLRVWNAFTGFWRGDFTFPTSQGTVWYDLTAQPNTLRSYTLQDTSIYTDIQYALLEPVAWNPWTGASSQFSADDLLNAVARRRDEILAVSGCTHTRRLVPAVAGRITLPDSVIDVRRVAYQPIALVGDPYGSGAYGMGPYQWASYDALVSSPVWPEDTWAERAFNPRYAQSAPGVPTVYFMSNKPPISFDVDVPPGGAGNYELLIIEAGGTLSISTPSTLSIPDDWAHLIKWGALADLLSRESNARDPLRAQYCESRYRLGLAALLSSPSLLSMRVNDVPIQIDSVRSADLYNTGWEGLAQQAPQTAYFAGLNLVGISPPDAGPYTFSANVVENAPIPTSSSDLVQVARENLDAIIDYAQHIAAFKEGGAEFTATMPLLQRFMKQAALYNAKLNELGEFTSKLYGLGQREESTNPRATPDLAQVTQ